LKNIAPDLLVSWLYHGFLWIPFDAIIKPWIQ